MTRDERDEQIRLAYLADPKMSEPALAKKFGITRHEVRSAMDRNRRCGLTVKRQAAPRVEPAQQREGTVVASVAQMSIARQNEAFRSVQVTLPRLTILEIDGHKPCVGRIVTAVPGLTAVEEMKMRRLAMLKQIHQDGLRRGKFVIHSR